jgi:hypothetical protein
MVDQTLFASARVLAGGETKINFVHKLAPSRRVTRRPNAAAGLDCSRYGATKRGAYSQVCVGLDCNRTRHGGRRRDDLLSRLDLLSLRDGLC